MKSLKQLFIYDLQLYLALLIFNYYYNKGWNSKCFSWLEGEYEYDYYLIQNNKNIYDHRE